MWLKLQCDQPDFLEYSTNFLNSKTLTLEPTHYAFIVELHCYMNTEYTLTFMPWQIILSTCSIAILKCVEGVILSIIDFIWIILYSSCTVMLQIYDITEVTHLRVVYWCLYCLIQGHRMGRPYDCVNGQMWVSINMPIVSFIRCGFTTIWNIITTIFTHDTSSSLCCNFIGITQIINLLITI